MDTMKSKTSAVDMRFETTAPYVVVPEETFEQNPLSRLESAIESVAGSSGVYSCSERSELPGCAVDLTDAHVSKLEKNPQVDYVNWNTKMIDYRAIPGDSGTQTTNPLNTNDNDPLDFLLCDQVKTTRMTARYLADLPLYETIKPYVLKREPPPGIPRSNVTLVPHEDVAVIDVRGQEGWFSLDQQGFQFARLPLREALDTPDSIARHLDEVCTFLQTLLVAGDVRVFEYKFRSSQPDINPRYRKPSSAVHVDQTADSACWRIQFHYPEEYQSLMKRRHRLINVWRPLNMTPVQDCPLALCDSRSVADSDLVACDLVYEHYEGEHFKVKFSPSHRWYFLRHQIRDEVVLIQNYDSGSNIRCPHTAFQDPQAADNISPRQSIEIRTLVFD